MPNLTRLKIHRLVHRFMENTITDLKTVKFHRSTTITDFEICFFSRFMVDPFELDMLRALFPLVPNVKHLTIDFASEVLDVIALNFPDLETLSIYNFSVEEVSCKKILNNLKKLSSSPFLRS